MSYYIIKRQPRKRQRKPKPCAYCQELVTDDYALSGESHSYPIICQTCGDQIDMLSWLVIDGWLTNDGKITAAFRKARKRFLK